MSKDQEYYCYILQSLDSNKTYVGSTLDPIRRLNEHNGLHKKGAKYTSGETWEMVAYVTGFNTFNQCLSFESSWKKCKAKRCKTTIQRRWLALRRLFSIGSPKKKWYTPPFTIHALDHYWYNSILESWNSKLPDHVVLRDDFLQSI